MANTATIFDNPCVLTASGFILLTESFDKVKVSQALDQAKSFVSHQAQSWWYVALLVQLILKWSGTTSRHRFTWLALNKQPPLSWLYKTAHYGSEGQTSQLTASAVQCSTCYSASFGSQYDWKSTVTFWLYIIMLYSTSTFDSVFTSELEKIKQT